MASVIRGSGASTLGGALDVQGVLTYEDVTSVDSVGIITARSGIHVSSGSVGIGTDAPGTLLELKGESSKEATVTFNRSPVQGTNDGIIGEFLFENNTDSVALLAVKRESAADDAYIQFATQSTGGGLTEKLRITSAGRIGIGSDTPSAKLDIYRSGSGAAARFGKETIFGELQVDGQRIGIQGKRSSDNAVSGFFVENPTSTGTSNFELVTIKTAGTERLRINSSGQVSLGNNPTVAADAALHIELDGTKEYLRLEGDGEGSNAYLEIEAPNNRRKAIIFKSGGTRRGVIGVGDSDEASATSLFLSASTNIAGNDPHMVIDSNGHVCVQGGSLCSGPSSGIGGDGATQNLGINQQFGGREEISSSNTYQRIFRCGHTFNGEVKLYFTVGDAVNGGGYMLQYRVMVVYGSPAVQLVDTRLYGNTSGQLSSPALQYNNSGYQMEAKITYTGTAPYVSYVVNGNASTIFVP